MSCITPSVQNIQTTKFNLIQNFYIIGFSPDDFFKINQKEKTGEFGDIFKEVISDMPKLNPKLITKFPNFKDSINSIPDDIVINHCFPKGVIEILKIQKDIDNKPNYFQFELDNIPQNYPNEEQKLYSKIYFSCLEFNECITEYFRYKKEIINVIFKTKSIKIINFDKNKPEGIDTEKKFSKFYIPKILCFASVMPFYNELNLILQNIYSYYLSRQDFASAPLEKIIEKIITMTPIPLKLGTAISINFKLYDKKAVQFPLCNINELNINYSANMSLAEIFNYFVIDDIIRIFRYMLYEVPILFFSSDKSILSLFINTFLTVLSPFKYVCPHISILPNSLFGLINSENKFIFGINQIYNENFFEENNLEVDKNMIIVSIIYDEKKKKFLGKIEEKNDISNHLIINKGFFSKIEKDYFTINQSKVFYSSIEIPSIFKKKLNDGINSIISYTKKKNFFSNKENLIKDLTFKIQKAFYKFFVSIMAGYSEFLLKSESFYRNPNNNGENIYFKNGKKYDITKELFNSEDFIAKSPKECQNFYKIIFGTKMFANFLHERIYNKDPVYLLSLRQFDQMTYIKKHTEIHKKKEIKSIYDNFKNDIIEKIKIEKTEEILLNDGNPFSNEEIISLITDEEKNTNILLKYGQLIKVKDFNSSSNNNKKEREKNNSKDNKDNYSKLIEIKYSIFPKLIFEYLENKNNLIFLNNEYLNNFISSCKQNKEECEKKRGYLFYEKIFEKINYTKIISRNYEISQVNYILYSWLILLSCSLWYCNENEKLFRIDKMFDILNKIDYFEEYVLNIVYINLYKYGDKLHFIKMYLFYIQVVGHMNYYLLDLLCDKVKKNENEITEKEINEQNEDFSQRYLIKLSNEFSNKRNKGPNDSITSEATEQIVFSSEQVCKYCNEVSDVNPVEFIQRKNIDINKESYEFKCKKCKNEKKEDIYIKYQILLYNYKKNDAYVTQSGKFKLLTPYKLYVDLKNYFIEENNIKLGISNIFNIEERINLINILFYFSFYSLSFDFLLPYVEKINTSMRIFFEKADNTSKNIKIMEKNVNEPVRISYKNETEVVFRRFSNIKPVVNLKKRTTILGIDFGTKYVPTDLSFTIKGKKKKK